MLKRVGFSEPLHRLAAALALALAFVVAAALPVVGSQSITWSGASAESGSLHRAGSAEPASGAAQVTSATTQANEFIDSGALSSQERDAASQDTSVQNGQLTRFLTGTQRRVEDPPGTSIPRPPQNASVQVFPAAR